MHEEAEAILATPTKQPVIDASAESWPLSRAVHYIQTFWNPQTTSDWLDKKLGAPSSKPFQKLLVPEDWTENIFFLNQLLPQSFEPFGELLNITIVLIIVITSICKSRALNTSTSFHFIFYHKFKKTGQHAETSFLIEFWFCSREAERCLPF